MLTVSQASKLVGRHVKTLQSWDRSGKLTAHRTATGRRWYERADIDSFLGRDREPSVRVRLAYCRVSSQAQKPDLKNQRSVVSDFCVAKGLANVEYIEEIGGGLNFKRPKFLSLLDRIVAGEVETLVVAHKDRLSRFGVDLIRHLCEMHRCEFMVINDERLSPEREMVEDLMTIVHCFSSRLYGLRNYRKSLKVALSEKAAA